MIDPDTLFYAPRLRRVLASAPRLDKCTPSVGAASLRWHGDNVLYTSRDSPGPLEVMGLGVAMKAFSGKWMDECAKQNDPREYGEDIWLIHVCLQVSMILPGSGMCVEELDGNFADIRYGIARESIRSIQPRDGQRCATPAFHWSPAFKDVGAFRTGAEHLLGLSWPHTANV